MDAREVRDLMLTYKEPYPASKWGPAGVVDFDTLGMWKVEFYGDCPPAKVEGLGEVRLVDDFGGEGQGDEYWAVWRVDFPNGDQKFYRADGYYQSYNGGELDGDLYEVQPFERTVTDWQKVK